MEVVPCSEEVPVAAHEDCCFRTQHVVPGSAQAEEGTYQVASGIRCLQAGLVVVGRIVSGKELELELGLEQVLVEPPSSSSADGAGRQRFLRHRPGPRDFLLVELVVAEAEVRHFESRV